jgi:hypothetical protein
MSTDNDDLDNTMRGLEAMVAAMQNNPNIDPADALAAGLRASGRHVIVMDADVTPEQIDAEMEAWMDEELARTEREWKERPEDAKKSDGQ